MSKDIIAIIVEGESREPKILESLEKTMLKHHKTKHIVLPVGFNIYNLWQKMNDDDFETNVLDVIKENCPTCSEQLKRITQENISETYLIFDYDRQNIENMKSKQNPDSILKEMLQSFNEETENGKLYISYPMVEAFRDFKDDYCNSATECIKSISEFKRYKKDTGEKSRHTYVENYKLSD